MRIASQRFQGFTLIEIMIVMAIIGLITAIVLPNYLKQRTYTQTQICIENLHKINSAKTIWGMENQKETDATPTDNDLFGANNYLDSKPECPAGGTYSLNSLANVPTCDVSGHEL